MNNDEYAFSFRKIVILIVIPKVILFDPNYYNYRYRENIIEINWSHNLYNIKSTN